MNGASLNGTAVNGTAHNGVAVNGTSGKTDIEIATGSVLLFAQRVADDTIADAHREAERILDEARGAVPRELAPADREEIAELRDLTEQLRVENRLRNLLMNDLVECVAELSDRVEREIGEAMDMLERARDRAVADFSAINALARLAGLPNASRPSSTRPEPRPVASSCRADRRRRSGFGQRPVRRRPPRRARRRPQLVGIRRFRRALRRPGRLHGVA